MISQFLTVHEENSGVALVDDENVTVVSERMRSTVTERLKTGQR